MTKKIIINKTLYAYIVIMKFKNTITLLIILTFLFLIIQNYRLIATSNQKKQIDVVSKSLLINTNMNKSTVNCLQNTYFCNTDSDCNDICSSQNGLFVCNTKLKICNPITSSSSNETTTEISSVTHCNTNHGFMNVVAYDPIFGFTWKCINLLSNIFDNNDSIQSFVCHNGKFEVDIEQKYPQINDCKCNLDDSVLCIRTNDIQTPRCINKNLLKFLPSFRQILKSSDY